MERKAMPGQRVVCLFGAFSFLMHGDPEEEEARYWKGAKGGEGQALPVLLAEGWRLVSVEGAGDGHAFAVLAR
jgi:hypothetical protein